MKDMKLAPLPKVEFSDQDAADMLWNSIKIIKKNCNGFSREMFFAKTIEEKKAAVDNFIYIHQVQGKVIELLLSECSVKYIAKGFMK